MKMIWQRKGFEWLFLGAMIALFSYSLFSSAIYAGHDSLYHINRLQGVVNALQDRQFLPAVYPYANNGYGYASPLFYCDLAVYPFAILYWIGVPLVSSYKLMIGFYGALAILSSYYVGKRLLGDYAYLACVLYSFCNYHLYDQYLRQAFGEVLAIAIFPWLILCFYELFKERKDCWLKLGGYFALLLLSHLLSFVLYCLLFGVLLLSCLWVDRHQSGAVKAILVTVGKAVALAIGLSAFHLFPLLEQLADQTFNVSLYSRTYNIMESALSLEMLLYPFCDINHVEFGRYYAFNMGLVYLIYPLLYVVLLNRRKGSFWLNVIFIIGLVCLLLSCGWFPGMAYLPFINTFQFAYRFYLVAFPLYTYFIAYCLKELGGWKCKLLLVLACAYSLINCLIIQNTALAADSLIPDSASHEELFALSLVKPGHDFNNLELSSGEYLPPTESTDYLNESLAIKITDGDEYFEVMDGNEYLAYERKGTAIEFSYAFEGETVMLPLTYYKGYRLFADDVELEPVYLAKYKKVAFVSLPGLHTYRCHYDGTIIQKASLGLSLVSLTVLVYFINRKYRYGK